MKKILIVDDDASIGNMLEEMLIKEGYAVLRAYSGTEALLVLREDRPNLVLLDLMTALVILVIGMIGYGEVVSSPDTVEIQWRIVELLFPSVLTLDVAAGLVQASYLSIVIVIERSGYQYFP